jgi:hypothetical protein
MYFSFQFKRYGNILFEVFEKLLLGQYIGFKQTKIKTAQ